MDGCLVESDAYLVNIGMVFYLIALLQSAFDPLGYDL